MSKIDSFLTRLSKVQKIGSDRWIACCPAHDDRSPSLSLKETSDGSVLLHCFAECEFGAVIAALGIKASDCFADGGKSTRRYRTDHRVHELDAEIAVLQSRYGFSPESARRLARIGKMRNLGMEGNDGA